MSFSAIDLFAGCGGLSVGFMKAGFAITKALEYDSIIAETYQRNHPGVQLFIDDIKKIDVSKTFSSHEADVIVGGPPCQGFSMAGARIRNGFIDDPRNYLFKNYFNIVKHICPTIFLMENVKGMLTMQHGDIFNEIQRVFSDAHMLESQPYSLFHKIVRAVDFGIPQKRERLVLLGVKKEHVDFLEIWERTKQELAKEIPDFFKPVTVREAIGNLPITCENGFVKNPVPESAYELFLASKGQMIANHTKSNHSSKAIERMHKIHSGENFTSLDEKINSVHSGAYGRLAWDEQAPTITTRFDTPAGGRFIHPTLDRTLSPREAARIQSFPDDFVFLGDKRSISRQIGNAVPPKMAYFLARFVRNLLGQQGEK